MAVATPVLEKRIEETQEETEYLYNVRKTEDELHNSQIKERYARLMNLQNTMSDLKPEPVEPSFVQAAAPVQNEIYKVEGARTSADLFRADSAINRKESIDEAEAQPVVAVQQVMFEEENEDLVPTRTTMQYTSANKEVDEEGSIENGATKKRVHLAKRDKVIIATVISVIVALFVLIIVNSAMISRVNGDIKNLQSSLNKARKAYEKVNDQLNEYQENFDETLQLIADDLGMVK